MGHNRAKAIRKANLTRGAVIPLVCLSVLLWSTSGPGQSGDAGPTSSAERTGPALRADDRITAILAPRYQAVLSAEVSGRVTAINKELGEPFGIGDVLVRLDDSPYQVTKRIAEATLESASSNLARVRKLADDKTRQRHAEAVRAAAKANLVATQRLYDNDHASQVDLENAKRDVTVAQTNCELVESTSREELIGAKRELVVATGKLDIAREQLEACTMAGPWAGRVKRVLVNEHELVQRGTPVIEVIDDRILLAKFLLPSSVFRSVCVGQELRLTVNEVSATVAMKVSHIAAALDPASVTFEVHAEVDNADGRLRAGMNGTVHLPGIRER